MSGPLIDVVGVGANAVDDVCRLPTYPEPGPETSKLRIERRWLSPGGQTATTLVTCAAAGLHAAYVGAVGNDSSGQLIIETLDRHGVDTSAVRRRAAPNASAIILLDRDLGERIVLWNRDPALALTPDEIPHPLLARARLVHVDDVDEDAALIAATTATEAGVPVTCDIEHITRRTDALLAAISFPIFAEHVPLQMTGEHDLERALRWLRQRHAGWLCVTRGSGGAAMLVGEQFLQQEAPAVTVADTTGAGDIFRGAFIAAYLGGREPAHVLRIAVHAASLSCSREGAISSVPAPDEWASLLTD